MQQRLIFIIEFRKMNEPIGRFCSGTSQITIRGDLVSAIICLFADRSGKDR